jgi:hypothetical protein
MSYANKRSRLGLGLTAVLVACINITGCGPALTTPGTTDVSGTWFAAGPAAGMSDITMVLTQTGDGHISGTFTATGTQGEQVCPATGVCSLSSKIDGLNTVLQISLNLIGAGSFTGQMTTTTELRGAIRQTDISPVSFERVAAP